MSFRHGIFFRRPEISAITKQALQWTSKATEEEGDQGTDLESEVMGTAGLKCSWRKIKAAAQDRTGRRKVVCRANMHLLTSATLNACTAMRSLVRVEAIVHAYQRSDKPTLTNEQQRMLNRLMINHQFDYLQNTVFTHL